MSVKDIIIQEPFRTDSITRGLSEEGYLSEQQTLANGGDAAARAVLAAMLALAVSDSDTEAQDYFNATLAAVDAVAAGGAGAASYIYPASASIISSPPPSGTSLAQVLSSPSKEATITALQGPDPGTSVEFEFEINLVSTAGAAATITIDFSGGNPLPGDFFSIEDPEFGIEIFDFQLPGQQAFGTITGTQPSIGDSLVYTSPSFFGLVNPAVFEFGSSVIPGSFPVTIGATFDATMANLVTEIGFADPTFDDMVGSYLSPVLTITAGLFAFPGSFANFGTVVLDISLAPTLIAGPEWATSPMGPDIFEFTNGADPPLPPSIEIGGTAAITAGNARARLNPPVSFIVTAAGSGTDVDLTRQSPGLIGNDAFIDLATATILALTNSNGSNFISGTGPTQFDILDNLGGGGIIDASVSWVPQGNTTDEATEIAQAINNEIGGWSATSAGNIVTVVRDDPGAFFTVGASASSNDIPTGHATITLTDPGSDPKVTGFRDTYLGQLIAVEGTDVRITNSYVEELVADRPVAANITVSPKGGIKFGDAIFDGVSDFRTHVALTPASGDGDKFFAQRVEIITVG